MKEETEMDKNGRIIYIERKKRDGWIDECR